jgi:hypothetical protein
VYRLTDNVDPSKSNNVDDVNISYYICSKHM